MCFRQKSPLYFCAIRYECTGTAAAASEQGIMTPDKEVCNKAVELCNGPVALSCFAERRIGKLKEVSIILEEVADHIQALTKVRQAWNQHDYFETMTLMQLEVFMLETFPGEEVLKKESSRVL